MRCVLSKFSATAATLSYLAGSRSTGSIAIGDLWDTLPLLGTSTR